MLKPLTIAATLCALALGALASTPVFAQHRHGGGHGGGRIGVGIYFGGPVYSPFYYPPYYAPPYYAPPYYAYPQPVYVTPSPPVYIERSDLPPAPQPVPQAAAPASQAPAPQDWYFCPESNAYYPYVRSCAAGWQRVAPQPPGAIN